MTLAKLRNIMDAFLKEATYLLTTKVLPMMNKINRFLLHKRKKIEIFLLLLFVLLTLLNGVKLIDGFFEHNIGYVETMMYIHSFDRILDGQVPFRDFYPPRGPLLLYLGVPLYKMLGENHFAHLFILFALFPAISVILLYVWARIFLKSILYNGTPR
ncbi:hypothetical protein ES703_86761 [subsurface metagenome]